MWWIIGGLILVLCIACAVFFWSAGVLGKHADELTDRAFEEFLKEEFGEPFEDRYERYT